MIHKPNKKIGYYGNVVAAPVVKQIAEAVIHDIPQYTTLNLNKIAGLAAPKAAVSDAYDLEKCLTCADGQPWMP